MAFKDSFVYHIFNNTLTSGPLKKLNLEEIEKLSQ